MDFFTLVLFAVIATSSKAIVCPYSINCGNLKTINGQSSNCALIQPPFITISIEGCNYTDNYSYCSFNDIMQIYPTVKNGESYAVNCSYWDPGVIQDNNKANTTIYAQNAAYYHQFKLKTGEHPKLCDTDLDCELLNGQFAKCQCSRLEKAFCSMSVGDTFMDRIFLYSQLNASDAVNYFLCYQQAYNYLLSPLDCSVLFIENELIVESTNTLTQQKASWETFYTAALWVGVSYLWLELW